MFRERAKQRLVKQIANESGAIEAITQIVAGLEEDLLTQIDELHAAQGIDYYDEIPDAEERSATLQELIFAQLSGNQRQCYVDIELGKHLENAEDAKPYLGLDPDEWEEQKEKWADAYAGKVERAEAMSTEEIAGTHVYQKFGVTLAEFERRVVEWDPGEMLEASIAGNMHAASAGIDRAREEVEAEESGD